MSPDVRDSIRHVRVYVWLFIAGLCFTAALYSVQRSSISRDRKATVSRQDLANAGARVAYSACVQSNQVSRGLRDALVGESAALELRRRQHTITPEQYEFSRRTLDRQVKAVPQGDCMARARLLIQAPTKRFP